MRKDAKSGGNCISLIHLTDKNFSFSWGFRIYRYFLFVWFRKGIIYLADWCDCVYFGGVLVFLVAVPEDTWTLTIHLRCFCTPYILQIYVVDNSFPDATDPIFQVCRGLCENGRRGELGLLWTYNRTFCETWNDSMHLERRQIKDRNAFSNKPSSRGCLFSPFFRFRFLKPRKVEGVETNQIHNPYIVYLSFISAI